MQFETKIAVVLRDDLALEVLPGTGPDAIAGIDRSALRGGIGTEVGAPGLDACARRRCERLPSFRAKLPARLERLVDDLDHAILL